ncbi:hypothetical protein HPB48_013256 [Haemaphysalis longicornis]|uniref:Uncharacterized protein n=1 Tax=Haemaphysalis longicornis TaxID=44386 RepID=A0A9J6H4K4_HAELO|nr:hypothetical protein HPB48_013256 [Haemaphysalis longicornis]
MQENGIPCLEVSCSLSVFIVPAAVELRAAPIGQATMVMAMQITVEEEDISPEEFSNGAEWTTSVNKRKSASKDAPEQGDRARPHCEAGRKALPWRT